MLSFCDWLQRSQSLKRGEWINLNTNAKLSMRCEILSALLSFFLIPIESKWQNRKGRFTPHGENVETPCRLFYFLLEWKSTAPRFRPPWIPTKKRIVPLFPCGPCRTVLNSCGDGTTLYSTFGKDIEMVNMLLCFRFGKATTARVFLFTVNSFFNNYLRVEGKNSIKEWWHLIK